MTKRRQEKPIRHSEKPIRHATGREQQGGRGSVQRYQLPRGIVDESHLTGKLRGELSHALTEAAVVRASKEVWDRAAAITADGKFLAERIAGAIERFQLGEDITDDLDLIIDTRETLALDPDDPEQFASIRQNAAMLENVVGRLDSANDELWFSSIKQTAAEIESVVSVLNLAADDPEQFSSIRQTAGEIESIVTLLEGTPDAAGQFSSIRQTHEQITQVVAMLESDPDDPQQYSAIRQMVDEIDLRVKSDDIINAINLSTEGVRIKGNRVEIDSDTIIAKGAIHAEALNIGRIPSSLPQGAHLFHFDGSLASTQGLRPLPGYVATLRPGEGRFGGAVAVEEGTTNCIVSRDFETWGSYVTGNATGTVEFRQDPIYGKVVKLKKTDGGSGRFGLRGTLSGLSGSIYTHSVYVRALSGTGRIACMYVDAAKTGGGLIVSENYRNLSDLPLGQWVRITTTKDGSPDTLAGGGSVFVWVDTDNGECEFAYPQVEAKPFATSFVDGTRAAGRLEYPGAIPSNEGTLLIWAKKNTLEPNTRDRFRKILDAQLPRIDFQWSESGNLSANFGGASLRIPDPAQDLDWHQYAITYSGRTVKMYFDGQLVASGQAQEDLVNFSELCVGARWDGRGAGNALYDELLILPYAASEEEIKAWYEADGPLYRDKFLGIETPGGHLIELNPSDGLVMTPAIEGFDHPGMKLDGLMLGFWDKHNVPAIGVGYVKEMAQQLGSDMEYGLLLNQGEIRASQAVLEASLTDMGVTRDKLGPGAVGSDQIDDGSIVERKIPVGGIGISRLGEQIQVPLLLKDNMNVLRMEDTSSVSRSTGTAGTWYDIGSALTFPKTDRSRGLLVEALKVVLNVRTTEAVRTDRVAIRLRVNNQTVAEWPYGSFEDDSEYKIVVYVDARSLPADGQVTVQWQWRRNQDWRGAGRMSSNLRQVFQNDQLPLRWGAPQYALEEGTPSGCFGGCQVSCQSGCEATCQGTCESSCQDTCQRSCQSSCESSCQSTCESSSQGGGGCIREGTPITIWDEDIQEYREVPIETLEPGMILPGYNPETDTVEHGELLELQDARFSNRFLRIHTENGPSVDVTYTQPFDVLADMGDGPKWYKLAAKFLQPGMKLVRPFDDEGKRLSTITNVEHVKEYMVRFWFPKTSHGYVTVAGYGDIFLIK